MPELPDVEVFKRTLDATSLHREIAHAMVRQSRVLRCAPSTLRRNLEGERLTETRRHGKHLFAAISNGRWLEMHFGMTGDLRAFQKQEREPEHVQLRLDFTDGWHLAYVNTRLLGRLDVVQDPAAVIEELGLGPDALDLDGGQFRELLEGRRGMVKPTLMNQDVIAGLGNVWTDEILFQAGLHPETEISDLDRDDIASLFRTMRKVLSLGIEHGVDPGELPDSFLLTQREEEAECPRGCGGTVRRIRVSGRAGYYCPRCQPRP